VLGKVNLPNRSYQVGYSDQGMRGMKFVKKRY
jgi:hypothetical protein